MTSFSALQRAEIAEIARALEDLGERDRFSALQRAEIAEIALQRRNAVRLHSFSALQRAEIAEIGDSSFFSLPRERFQCSSTSRNC